MLDVHEADVSDTAARFWEDELSKATAAGREPNLFPVWHRIARTNWYIGSALGFANGLLTVVARPVVLRQLIRATTDASGDYSAGAAYALAVGLYVVVVLETWTRAASKYYAGDCGPLQCVSGTVHTLSARAWR